MSGRERSTSVHAGSCYFFFTGAVHCHLFILDQRTLMLLHVVKVSVYFETKFEF